MKPQCVLLLEAAKPESQGIVTAATAFGIDVHAATHPGMAAVYPTALREYLRGVVFTDFTDSDRAVCELVAYALHHRIDGVLTLHEFLTPLAARLSAALRLPGNDPALARTARNKVAMLERFTARSVPTPATLVLKNERELLAQLDAGGHGDGFPLVIKPAEHAGSTGVTVAATRREAVEAFRYASRCNRQDHYGLALDPRVLLQEHVNGTEYSVESVTQYGITTHLSITRKQTTTGRSRVETGHSLPAALPPQQTAAVLNAATLAVTAVGILDSFSHTEIILAPDDRAVVIETAARPGSGHIGTLLQHSLGLDPWRICLDLALGRPADLTPTRHGYAAVRFLTSPVPGRLAALHGTPDVGPGVPAVHLRRAIGDPVEAPSGNSARIGHLIVTGDDPAEVDARADALRAAVRVEVHAEPANT